MPHVVQSALPNALASATSSLKQNNASGHSGPIDEIIKHDHKEIFAWYDKYVSTLATDKEEAEKWKNNLIFEVARHSVAEELILYPVLEERLPNGKALADESRHEHAKCNKELSIIDAHEIKNITDYDSILKRVIEELREHIRHEEEKELPALMAAISAEEAQELGKKLQAAKMLAPTHPHTAAPQDGGLGEQIMGLLVKPMDKLRDALRTFPSEDECHKVLSAYKDSGARA